MSIHVRLGVIGRMNGTTIDGIPNGKTIASVTGITTQTWKGACRGISDNRARRSFMLSKMGTETVKILVVSVQRGSGFGRQPRKRASGTRTTTEREESDRKGLKAHARIDSHRTNSERFFAFTHEDKRK